MRTRKDLRHLTKMLKINWGKVTGIRQGPQGSLHLLRQSWPQGSFFWQGSSQMARECFSLT